MPGGHHRPFEVRVGLHNNATKVRYFSIYACHPCAGAMLIFSVSFQFLRMTTEVVPVSLPLLASINVQFGPHIQNHFATSEANTFIQQQHVCKRTVSLPHPPETQLCRAECGELVYMKKTRKSDSREIRTHAGCPINLAG